MMSKRARVEELAYNKANPVFLDARHVKSFQIQNLDTFLLFYAEIEPCLSTLRKTLTINTGPKVSDKVCVNAFMSCFERKMCA